MDTAAILHLLYSLWLLAVQHADWIVGFGMPFLIQFLTSERDMSDDAKVWLAVISCYLAAILFQWNAIKYGSLIEVVQSFGVIFAESHLVFITFFRASQWRARMMEILDVSPKEIPQEQTQVSTVKQPIGQG